MKPVAPGSGLALPTAAALAALPLAAEVPLWGGTALLACAGWVFKLWRRRLDDRPPYPCPTGEAFAPLDVSIAWRTPLGLFPAARRGWRAVVTETDLWIAPVRPIMPFGDRDYVRVSRLDLVRCEPLSDAEVGLTFLDEEGRAQEARLRGSAQAMPLATALGYSAPSGPGSSVADRGPLE